MQESEGGDFVGGQSEIVPEASLQVSCIWCGRLHQVERPLEFHPVCPTCTGRFPMGSLEMNGSYPLSDEAIDEVMKLGMNHPMGPLALADLIGLDTCLAIMETLCDGFKDSKYRPCPLLRKYVEAGWLGRKSGKGFYQY